MISGLRRRVGGREEGCFSFPEEEGEFFEEAAHLLELRTDQRVAVGGIEVAAILPKYRDKIRPDIIGSTIDGL